MRYEAEKKLAHRPAKGVQSEPLTEPNKTAKRIATGLDVGTSTVKRAAEYARAVDTLAEVSPTIKRKILSGESTSRAPPSWRSPRSRAPCATWRSSGWNIAIRLNPR